MKNYKNIQNIKTAKLDELMTIKGINEKIAKEIISYNN
jgi:excinuclease UvrABC nuclease subunit